MFECGVHFGILSGKYDYEMVNTLMFMDGEIISNGVNDGLGGVYRSVNVIRRRCDVEVGYWSSAYTRRVVHLRQPSPMTC